MYNIGELYATFYFDNINPQKKSIIFTWDDNFERHIKYIAPVFKRYHKKVHSILIQERQISRIYYNQDIQH